MSERNEMLGKQLDSAIRYLLDKNTFVRNREFLVEVPQDLWHHAHAGGVFEFEYPANYVRVSVSVTRPIQTLLP